MIDILASMRQYLIALFLGLCFLLIVPDRLDLPLSVALAILIQKFLIGFYFPHDTPPEMGPTRIYAGSQYYSKPLVPPKTFSLLGFKSGSFVLAHFDIVHAAFPNQTDQTRFMIKFVFARTKQQVAPTWNHLDEKWNTPKNLLSQKRDQMRILKLFEITFSSCLQKFVVSILQKIQKEKIFSKNLKFFQKSENFRKI